MKFFIFAVIGVVTIAVAVALLRRVTDSSPSPSATTPTSTITGGVKRSIPLEEILSGGPPKDGIPSIDSPKFVSVAEAGEWLKDDEPGIALSLNSVDRFYPYQIMVWHEIVNDTVNGRRVLVTYCPLCLAGLVFDPVV